MLGGVGDGLRIALHSLDVGRLFNAAVSVGIAQHALEESVAYAKVRRQFGKPIIDNQAVQIMLADMQMNTEAARSMLHSEMRLVDEGVENVSMEASCCKTFASDNAVRCACDAVQIFGGYGYSKEYPVEKIMRDAKIFQIFEGTNQIQRLVIARELKKRY
jgi:alkylation response protein AidB-like acyl-CoA dehydrogenase